MANYRPVFSLISVLFCTLVAAPSLGQVIAQDLAFTGAPPVRNPANLADPQNPLPETPASFRGLEDSYLGDVQRHALRLPIPADAAGEPRRGFPLNISLGLWPLQPDFGPRTLDPTFGSCPLLSSQTMAPSGAFAQRRTLGGVVDLITGNPLVQETDLELPFGGAIYRHTRTYSTAASVRLRDFQGYGLEQYLYWDWTGYGWMLNVSPLLLIDAAFPEITGLHDPESGVRTAKRRTWFIPDAHYCIPFDRDEASGQYIAPINIDAQLTHDGQGWNASTGNWSVRPTHYYVHMFGGTIRYTIRAVYDDVPTVRDSFGPNNEALVDSHLPPQFNADGQWLNGSFGIPHYGVTTKIEDNLGHRIEIDVVTTPFEQTLDSPCTNADPGADPPIPPLVEFLQNINAKGQVRSVRLVHAPPNTPEVTEWLLAFTYRDFWGLRWPLAGFGCEAGSVSGPWTQAETLRWMNPTMLHSVRVYRRPTAAEISQVSQRATPVINGIHFLVSNTNPITPRQSFDELDATDLVQDLPSNWQYEVKYLYSETSPITDIDLNQTPNQPTWSGRGDMIDLFESLGRPGIALRAGQFMGWPHTNYSACLGNSTNPSSFLWGAVPNLPAGTAPLLLKKEVVRRESPGVSTNQRRESSLYWYRASQTFAHHPQFGTAPKNHATLHAVASDSAVRRILSGIKPWRQNQSVVTRNDLLDLPLNERFCWHNPETDVDEPKRIADFVDQVFARDSAADFLSHSTVGEIIRGSEVNPGGFVGVSLEKLVAFKDCENQYSGHILRGAGSDSGTYRLYHFLVKPQGSAPPNDGVHEHGVYGTGLGTAQPSDSLFHRPYKWNSWEICPGYRDWTSSCGGLGTDGRPRTAPPLAVTSIDGSSLGEPTFVTVVDQVAADDPDSITDINAYPAVKARRVIWFNKAGYIISERQWNFVEGSAGLVAQSGFIEEHRYDEHYRLTEKRSKGYSAAVAAQQADSQGLITVFSYPDDPGNPDERGRVPREFDRMGIQSGSLRTGSDGFGRVTWLKKIERMSTRRELVLREVSYPDGWPNGASESSVSKIETTNEYLFGAPIYSGAKAPIATKIVRRSPHSRDGSSTLHTPVTVERFDDGGRPIWSGYGHLVDAVSGPQPSVDEFYWDFTAYDDQSRPIVQIKDVRNHDSGNPVPPVVRADSTVVNVPTDRPLGWTRCTISPLTANAAHAVVSTYHTDSGPSRMDKPGGRSDFFFYEQTEAGTTKRTYADVVLGGSQFVPLVLGQVEDYQGEKLVLARSVRWSDVSTAEPTGFETFEVVSTTTPTYDSSGRPSAVGLAGATNSTPVAASIKLDQFDQRVREVAPDGTITRNWYDGLGRLVKTFRGTSDTHARWWPGQTPPPGPADNMVLTEKRSFGSTVRDADLPIKNRKYRQPPSDPFAPIGAGPAQNGPVPDETTGWIEQTEYDLAMRPVVTTIRGEADDQALSHSVSFIDLSGRTRFAATYVPGMQLGAIDPRNRFAEPLPTISQILATYPVSLTETLYNARGEVEETRQYRCGDLSASGHIASFNYQDHAGRTIRQVSSNGGVSVTVFDAEGRELRSTQVAAGVEVSDRSTTYDGRNAVAVESRDRTVFDTNPSLGAGNSVRSVQYSWHDTGGRVIATADLGSGSSDNTYANNAAFPARPTQAPVWDAQAGAYSCPGLPSWVRITLQTYNDKGAVEHARAANGKLTRNFYDDLNQLVLTVQNAEGDAALQLRTAYRYANGQLDAIAHVLPSHTVQATGIINFDDLDSTLQITHVTHGADVVDAQFQVVSSDKTKPSLMYMPRLVPTGTTTPDLRFRYTIDGQVAERIDKRGLCFRYRYDERGRLTSVEVGSYGPSGSSGTFISGYPSGLGPAGAVPADRVGCVEYRYNTRGQLSDVRAYSRREEPRALITHNRMSFDRRGNLFREFQSLGEFIPDQIETDFNYNGDIDPDDLGDYIVCFFAVPPCPDADVNGDGNVDPDDLGDYIAAYFGTPTTVPFIGYVWSYEPADGTAPGHDRLAYMKYPMHAGLSMEARMLAFGYGTGGDADSVLARITSLDTSTALGGQNIGRFGYAGGGRRLGMWLGASDSPPHAAVTQALRPGSGAAVAGLDRFQRLADLHYANAASETLYRALYAYDQAGSRLTAEVVRAAAASSLTGHYLEQNTYDALDRLIGTRHQTLTNAVGGTPAIGSTPRTDTWQLDLLGNWVGHGSPILGAPAGVGRWTDGPLGGLSGDYTEATHAVDTRNQLTSVTRANESGSLSTAHQYDTAGNLSFDGTYLYQYDAWNRLVQVNLAQLSQAVSSGGGDATPIAVGELVKHFTYDGQGRLVRTISPLHGPESGDGQVRNERFFYDGIRRVQEVATDLDAPDSQSGQRAVLETGLAREYVWGPGDGPAGVDELLAQFDGADQAKPWWVLQDGGGDVIALCDGAGAAVPASAGLPQGAPSRGRVVGQWTYDAYGSVLTAQGSETFGVVFPPIHCGHKGLFLDRLDAPIVTTGGVESTRLAWGAASLTYARNRTYVPALGRWLQSDPKATGMVFWESPFPNAPELREHYSDGMSVHEYCGSNAMIRADPLGLDWDAWDAGAFALGAMDPAGVIDSMFSAVFEQYAANLDYDVAWATDWATADDWSTRNDNRWVEIALLVGAAEHYGVGFDDFMQPESSSPAQAGVTAIGGRIASALGRVGSRIRGIARTNIIKAALSKGADIDPSDKGKALTYVGRAIDKHKGVLQVLGPGVKLGGDVASKNKIGMQAAQKLATTGICVSLSKTQCKFFDPNLRKLAMKVSFDKNGLPFRVDFLE